MAGFSCSLQYDQYQTILLGLMMMMTALSLGSFSCVCRAQDPSQLSLDYYSKTCPDAQKVVRTEMECAVKENPRNAAAILRLHFHDCFVQGCDGSILLDDTATLKGEKTASQNANSLIGFDLVDRIKNQLESQCPGTVSCADLLAIAARDATLLLGGPYWDVPVGRKDAKSTSLELADADIPTPDQGLIAQMTKFLEKGLSVTDLVALVGAHTVGMARCASFRGRIYGGFELTSGFGPASEALLGKLRETCPASGGDGNVAAMDYVTPYLFDNAFYESLVAGDGLLGSDQELYSSLVGFETADLVKTYASDAIAFFEQFSESMVKMGNITNPEGGEVRKMCRFVNT
ncbi:peroxidase 11-like [Iris pallida]|uniref:Peroxidase n=1 Tax=Iris pallida TaxID=29817 RepID=A0AAX6ETA6_IRIPA|nr:peroxidase 11-like [Iris pallida]